MLGDPTCLPLNCYLDDLGLTAQVTFRRVDDSASEPADQMYRERREADKTYLTWELKGMADPKPKENIMGGVGAEVSADLRVLVYELTAQGGTESGEVYDPREEDQILFRGRVYDVTRVDPIHPSGTGSQIGYDILARKFR